MFFLYHNIKKHKCQLFWVNLFNSKGLIYKKRGYSIGEACRIRIQELCRERNITVNKLAIISGITQSTLNNIVSGRNNSATVSTVKKLFDGLDISIIDFFNAEVFENLEQEIK